MMKVMTEAGRSVKLALDRLVEVKTADRKLGTGME